MFKTYKVITHRHPGRKKTPGQSRPSNHGHWRLESRSLPQRQRDFSDGLTLAKKQHIRSFCDFRNSTRPQKDLTSLKITPLPTIVEETPQSGNTDTDNVFSLTVSRNSTKAPTNILIPFQFLPRHDITKKQTSQFQCVNFYNSSNYSN